MLKLVVKCNVCGKAFVLNIHLMHHLRKKHTIEEPYERDASNTTATTLTTMNVMHEEETFLETVT